MSNIRQRRAPSPSRDSYGVSSASWEIATEGSGEKAHSSARKSIPMYTPMAMQSPSSQSNALPPQFPPSPSNNSRQTSWNTIMQAKNTNLEYLRDNPATRTYHDPPGYYGDSISGKEGAYGLLRSGRSLPSMSPKLIPDSAYRAYLAGQPAVKTKKPIIDKITLAKIAGFFSIVGFIFLTFVGILIDTQPMFMQGILTKNEEYSSNGKKMKTFYAISIKDRLEPAKHAYRGGLLYLLVAIGCFGYAHNMHHFLFKKGWQQYRDIDDVDSTVATFHRNGEGILGGKKDFLPTNGAIHRQAYEDHNGFLLRVWQSTSIRLQRLGFYLESIWQARRRNRRRFAGAKDV
mmetsp:Transcript_675/g.1628  ORF Transcript_675/g.1628 Transcript_675/m.1628 type:complete len:345 (-) Transcript_675:490-1524(-)|eukprot:CAMPEP_0116140212 /NCGR_PEP_ID=MMETSP0329-20121206/13719_1 /TAXON_ID=697910 /ORGANISM="Pseudo-nitzschia arenysensis, Strain B593" /LENGTH=344 /DNA_ID=CAMNT_0003635295 /DNA_START=118 /DNA_END=1152 /DNA_ORIENTATION=-